MIKKIGILVLCLFLIFFLSKVWQLLTDGFRLDKIKVMLPESLEEPSIEVIDLLKQPFSYLGKGCQAFVFMSQDKNMVVKFVRYHKYRLPFWMNEIRFVQKGEKFREWRLAHRRKSKKMTLTSYRLASGPMKKDAKVFYVHLEKTKSLPKLVLKDRLGRSFTTDLNEVGFILQKKVSRLEDQLYSLQEKNNLKGLSEILDSFFQLSKRMYRKGIVNLDYNCIKNSGFDDGVTAIDVGSFYPREGMEYLENRQKELLIYSKHFRKWLMKHWPEGVPLFEEKQKEALEYL